MSREENIFFNIIKNETSLTEVFCNLLSYKAFRDLFLDIVNKKRTLLEDRQFSLSSINYKNFSTEKNFGKDEDENNNIGRGDLILEDSSEIEYIFELKIEKYTKPTKNQPEGYLCYLKNNNERLFFIIPKRYMHTNEIYSRWHSQTGYSIEKIKNYHIIYWEDILNEIKQKELDKLNVFIDAFCKILEYKWFDYADIRFSSFEIQILFKKQEKNNEESSMLLDVNIPKVISKLFQVVEDVKLDVKTDKASVARASEYYGYILINKDLPKEWEVWFGVDFEIWEKYNFPLTIQIYSENEDEMEKIKNLNISTSFVYEDKNETTFIGLDKKVFESKTDNIISVLEEKIIDICNEIKEKTNGI